MAQTKIDRSQGSGVAPYVSFKTFLNSLDLLGPHTPTRVDRSVWSSFSGAVVSQLLGTYRFLRLIDSDNESTDLLTRMVEQPMARKDLLRTLLENCYEDIVSIGLTKASPKQLDEAMEAYNVSGATLRKAVTFFLQAATFAQLPLSQFLAKRKGRGRRKGSIRQRNGSGVPEANDSTIQANPAAPQGTTKTVHLRSGGEITLAVNFDAFTISQEDRDFVFGFIDQLMVYKRSEETPVRMPRRPDVEIPPENVDQSITDDDVPF